MEAQDSELSRNVTWQRQQAPGSIVSWRIAGPILGDQQEHIVHILLLFITLHIMVLFTYKLFYAYIRSMTSSLARDRAYDIVVMQNFSKKE